MGGFKSGAADDDWGDEESAENIENTQEDSSPQSESQTSEPAYERGHTTKAQAQSSRLPWIHRRSSITDGREKTVQLHLQDSTVDTEREGKRDIEQRLGESVRKADLREAALLVGLQHTNEISDLLREWGYAVD